MLSVISWRTRRQRVAPTVRRMAISRCRPARARQQKIGDVGAGHQQHQTDRREDYRANASNHAPHFGQ